MLLLVAFSLVAAACLAGSFWFIDGDYTLLLVKHGGYWLLLFAFLIFLYAVFQNRNLYWKNPTALIRQNKWVFIVSALIVGLYFLLQESWFKITMDEVVLASTSMHLHLEKEVFTASRGYEVNGVFYILGGYLDKRPYFFAFVVSLVHDIFGYRSGNVYFVNAVICFFLLGAMFFIGKLFGGKRWGWLSMLLLISLPMFGLNVTGGGFELFNLLMILVTAYLGKCWVERPSKTSLVAFTYSGLLLAQCRYESILFVIPVGLLILFVWWKEKKILLPWPLFFAPLILVPYVLQNRMLNQSKVLWQLEDHQSAPFGFQYLEQNLYSAANFFFHLGNDQGNSLLILGIAVVSIVLWLVYKLHFAAFYPREKTGWRLVAWVFGLTILFNFILLMFYYWGQLDDPVATRLGLPFHLALIVFSTYVLSRTPWKDLVGPAGIIGSLAFLWFFTLPNVAQSRYLRGGYDARQIKWANSIIENRSGPLLVLYDYHLAGLVEGISAAPIGHGIERKPELNFHLTNKTFSEILIVQRESRIEGLASEVIHSQQQNELAKHFELEPLYSYELGPGFIAAIHRINKIHLSEQETKVYQEHLVEFANAAADPKEDLTAYFSKWLP
jgi:hypothetical protein